MTALVAIDGGKTEAAIGRETLAAAAAGVGCCSLARASEYRCG
jgi:hypothetical protein